MNTQEIGKRLITGNIIINLLGNVIPMLFAITSIPFLINELGKEGFAILSIGWLFLGYFSILDLGIGRATTKFVIEYHSIGLVKEVKSLVWTSIILLFLFGLLIGTLLFFFTPYVVNKFLNIPPDLKYTTEKIFYVISITIPFVMGVAGAKGMLEAQQKFVLLNIIKIPSSILNYLIPTVVVLLAENLFIIILLLSFTRVLLFFVHLFFCFKDFNEEDNSKKFEWIHVRKLVSYGSWLTISNLVGPIMVYFDRFIIGSILTLTLLTYYSTPYEVITKLLVVAGSASAVLFPVFTSQNLRDKIKFYDIYNKSIKGIFFLLFPITFFLACFSPDILRLWLNDDFSQKSSFVMQLLSLGVFLNSISAIPFTAIQALNRPDLTAKVHLFELPIYLIALWFLAIHFSITGVAIAWMLRNLVDTILFMVIYERLTMRQLTNRIIFWAFSLIVSIGCFAIASLLLNQGPEFRIFTYLLVVVIFVTLFWIRGLNYEERSAIQNIILKKI